jgi:hypothetical protein
VTRPQIILKSGTGLKEKSRSKKTPELLTLNDTEGRGIVASYSMTPIQKPEFTGASRGKESMWRRCLGAMGTRMVGVEAHLV